MVLEIEESGGESLLSAAMAKLKAEEEAARLLGVQEEEGEPSKRPGRKPRGAGKRPGPAMAAETLAETIGVPLILGLAAAILVEEARPTADEAKAFITPIFRIAMRHLPLTGKLNADLIDLVAAFAAAAAWYARVRDHLMPRGKEKKSVLGGNTQRPTDLLANYVAGGQM